VLIFSQFFQTLKSLLVSNGHYNCSGERSFSKLKRIKNELRSTMRQDRLNHLTSMSLEHEVLREIDLTELIDKFAKIKAREMPLQSAPSSTGEFNLTVTLYREYLNLSNSSC
jgi:hypothetical protein